MAASDRRLAVDTADLDALTARLAHVLERVTDLDRVLGDVLGAASVAVGHSAGAAAFRPGFTTAGIAATESLDALRTALGAHHRAVASGAGAIEEADADASPRSAPGGPAR